MSNGPSPRSLSRIEVAVLLGISITGHTALAYKVSRARAAEPQVVAQSVSIEMEPAQVEPPKVPPPPEREPPRPLVAAHRPSVRPQFDPPAPVEQPPATDEPEPLVPALAPPAAPVGPPGPP